MTDDLTNPDVLAALEIAEVTWETEDGKFRLVVDVSKKREIRVECFYDVDGPPRWEDDYDATPADLDHALKEWLLWLDKRTPHTVLLTLFDGEARCTLDDAAERFVDEDGESPLLAVAKAVVKVGKPEGEESENAS